MADAKKLAVSKRTILGKKVSRLRREGKIPGVLAGHGDSVPFETDAHAFELGYRSWGRTTLLSLEGLDGGEVPALIHGISRDPRTGALLHVDLQRVSLTERTHAEVPIHFVGDAPATKSGAVLVHALEHLDIEAFPQDIPHRIDVDVSSIEQIDDAIYVRDVKCDPTKVRVLNEPDELVAKAVAVRAEAEPTPAVAAEPVEGEAAAPAAGAAGAAPAGAAAPAAGAKPGAAPAAGAKPGAPAAGAAKPGAAPSPAPKGAKKEG